MCHYVHIHKYIYIHTNGAGGISRIYTTLQVVYETYTPLCEMTDFLCCFWMKLRLSLPDYGASLGKCLKRFHSQNYVIAKKNIESQLPPIFMYRRHHVFHLCSLFSSSCQRRLAYILYESWLCGVFRVYTTLKPWSYTLQTSDDLDSRVVHHVTMIYTVQVSIYSSNVK